MLPLLFLIVILSLSVSVKSGESVNSTVKVNILSKQLRLMKEGKLKEISFHFPDGTFISRYKKQAPLRKLGITHNGTSFIVRSGSKTFNKNIEIYSVKSSCFKCRFSGEKRSYPLPLKIINEKSSLKIIIKEEINNYAMDSAYAELGRDDSKSWESLFALAHIIKARAKSPVYKKHKGYDFCDLTCCQVYRGRTHLSFSDRFEIQNGSELPLYFHSSNGGRIFTESVFNRGRRKYKPADEYSWNDKTPLSRSKHMGWKRKLLTLELTKILSPRFKNIYGVRYFTEHEQILVKCERGEEFMAPETFRLFINRKMGWNFLKSNNYSMRTEGSSIFFKGNGLGHGVGLSLEGSLELSKMAYSRREILEHYFPHIKFSETNQDKPEFSGLHVTFDLFTGKIYETSGTPLLLNRKVPWGSVIKTITALYLAMDRKDIFHNHIYNCSGKHEVPGWNKLLCWKIGGHGRVMFKDALSDSCNLYFASLHDKIEQKDFFRFLKLMERDYGIRFNLKKKYSSREFSRLLCGLDFEAKVSVRDLVKLTVLLHSLKEKSKMKGFLVYINKEESDVIVEALSHTFTRGTASEDIIKFTDNPQGLWGKTGTVLTGTNFHKSYGIFIGGNESIGIVSILPHGNGKRCAQESVTLLERRIK